MTGMLEPSTGDNRLPALAGEIEAAHQRCKAGVRDALEAALAAGKALNEARELVPHGQWQDWLQTNVPDVSVRTAQRYMKAAEKAKNDTVSFSSLRELLAPKQRSPLAWGEWLFTFDADGKIGSTRVPLDEPAVTRILHDAYWLMEPYRYRWDRLLKVLPEGRLQAIAREVGT